MTLTDFYKGATKNFDVTITYNGSNPDITSDAVSMVFTKSKTSTSALTKSADVATQGASGIASFALATSDTASLNVGDYFYEIYWIPASGGKHILEQANVTVKESLSD